MKYLAILLLIPALGACAAHTEATGAQADLRTSYVYTLNRQARQGFKTIYWVAPPTNAQVAKRVGSEDETD